MRQRIISLWPTKCVSLSQTKMKFSPRELELILRALKNYQIHGAAITASDYYVASDLMELIREKLSRPKNTFLF